MESGKLRHVIDIESKTNNPDGAGGFTETWTVLYKSVRASISTKAAQENTDTQQTQAGATHEIRCRYCPGINPAMRINYKSRIFNIVSVINKQEKDRELIIMAKEVF